MFVKNQQFCLASVKSEVPIGEPSERSSRQLDLELQSSRTGLFVFFCSTRASHCCDLSRCGAQAPDAQAKRPWLTGPATLWHVGSSRTRARTRVPCISGWTQPLRHQGSPYQYDIFD